MLVHINVMAAINKKSADLITAERILKLLVTHLKATNKIEIRTRYIHKEENSPAIPGASIIEITAVSRNLVLFNLERKMISRNVEIQYGKTTIGKVQDSKCQSVFVSVKGLNT